LLFLLVSFGVPVLLGQVAGIRPYQVPNVQSFRRPEGDVRILVYRMGIVIRQPDRPYIRYAFGLGLGPINISDISKPGIPRQYLEEHFGENELLTSTEAFCREAGLSDRRECIRRLVDLSLGRFKDVPADFWRGAFGDISSRASQAVCLNTDVVPSDFPPTVRFVFTLYMPFLITIVFESVLGALIVPILLCLYLLNRLVVRIGRRQIMRSENSLSLLAKYGSSFLALPVLLLLAVLQVVRNMYCAG
jgi:hypothetical protein